MNSENIQLLKETIESAIGFTPNTPKGFEHLSQMIEHRLHTPLSISTLKRLWGYIDGYKEVRSSTLDILCQFIGYKDMQHFISQSTDGEKTISSNIFFGNSLYTDTLHEGDTIRLTWSPGRVCDIEYLGGHSFKVVSSQNTRLIAGTTFKCSIIEEGEQIYLSHVKFHPNQQELLNYIAGKNGGVRFEMG